jgi:hypothetical protein
MQVSRQVTSLSDDRFASYERCREIIDSSCAVLVEAFTPVEQRDDYACVKQDRFQPPNPLRCFLLDPRSGTPEENLPNPAMRGRLGGG